MNVACEYEALMQMLTTGKNIASGGTAYFVTDWSWRPTRDFDDWRIDFSSPCRPKKVKFIFIHASDVSVKLLTITPLWSTMWNSAVYRVYKKSQPIFEASYLQNFIFCKVKLITFLERGES